MAKKKIEKFSDINRDRLIRLVEGVTPDLIGSLMVAIGELLQESKTKPIHILLNTKGGQTEAALNAYDELVMAKVKIITIASGQVASSGVPIFLSGQERFITENSNLTIHRVKGETQGRYYHEDFALMAKSLKFSEDSFIEIIAERTGQKIAKVKKDMYKGRIFTAEEAIHYGLAHKII